MEISNKVLEWIGGILAALGIGYGTFRFTKKKYVADTDLSKAQARKISTEETILLLDELKQMREEVQELMEKNAKLEQELREEKAKGLTLLRRITVLETYPFKQKP